MRNLISTAWPDLDDPHARGWGQDLASFALRESVERVVIANVIPITTDPKALFGNPRLHAELGEDSPLVRNADSLHLTWCMGHGDQILGNPRHGGRAFRAMLEDRGVTFLNSICPILDHDCVGRPELVMLMADGHPARSIRATRHTLKSLVHLAPPIIHQDIGATENMLRAVATRIMQKDRVTTFVHDLPGIPSWQRLGPHAGKGLWWGGPGRPPFVLMIDSTEPWDAKLIEL